MTPKQETHLQSLKDEFLKLVDVKYRKGQEEHGDDLIDNSELAILNFAIDEAVDQVVYLLTLRKKIIKGKIKNGQRAS